MPSIRARRYWDPLGRLSSGEYGGCWMRLRLHATGFDLVVFGSLVASGSIPHDGLQGALWRALWGVLWRALRNLAPTFKHGSDRLSFHIRGPVPLQDSFQCQLRVKGEQEHGSGKPPEDVHEQAPIGAYLRGPLNACLLIDPAQQGFNRLSHLTDGLLRMGCAMVHGMCNSLIKAFQGCSGPPEDLVDDEANHVGQQLRHDPRHHAPDRPRPRLFDLELVFQGSENALDPGAQAAMPSPKRCFPFGGGFSASAQRIPERPAVFAEETREPISAVVRPRSKRWS